MSRLLSATAASVGLVLVAAGCGRTAATSSRAGAEPRLPAAAAAVAAPKGYRIEHVWRADLSGGRVPDIVVSSVGPRTRGPYGPRAHPMDLRVLDRGGETGRWTVAFDAQKVAPGDTSCGPASSNDGPECWPSNGSADLAPDATPAILDASSDVTLGPVRFVHLLSGRREQLVFSAANDYGGSGVPMVLAVVDFRYSSWNLAYSWTGQDLVGWHVAHRRLYGKAMYWTGNDPHCCPLRAYRFTVAPQASEFGGFAETSDNRPWLGVTVRERQDSWSSGPLKVVGIAPYSPARRALRVGDLLLKVVNPPLRPHSPQPYLDFFDRLNLFRPGQVARLLVERDGARITVSVKLGSVKNAIYDVLPLNSLLTDI